jgi:UDP-2,4-diacetamido-2,4,6-trideoxy-beta-L-altropyranose hydrolase
MIEKQMIRLREIEISDVQIVFNWRNDPYIVNLGSLKKTVSWDEHMAWFKKTLTGVDRKAFILEINHMSAGQVRFDMHLENSCLISVYLIKEFSGKGYGIEFIKLGCRKIFSEWGKVKTIYALVRLDNKVGQKAFLKAGFLEDSYFQDENHIRYLIDRS